MPSLESLSRDTQAAIKTKCNAAEAQFDCSSAFNHGSHDDPVPHSLPVSTLCTPFLQHPLAYHAVRKEDGSTSSVLWNDGLTQGCPASPAAFSFLFLLVEKFFWPELAARAGEKAKEATDLIAHLDDLTLVTDVRYLEDAIRAMESAVAKARLIVNEMKGTVWTSTGMRPDGASAACGTMSRTTRASSWQDAPEPLTTKAAKHPPQCRW